MKSIAPIILIVTITSMTWMGSAQAGSILSAFGQGEMIHEADARLRGMGGAGLALTKGYNGSLLNPALLGGLKWTGITFSSRPEALYVKDAQNENVLTSARITNFALCLPMGKGLAIALDLRQLSDFKFKAYQDTTIFEETYLKSITRTGGLNMASVSLAKIFGSSFYVGARAGYVFGRTTQSRIGDFENTDIRDSKVSSNIENTGTRLSAGLALKFNQHFSSGMIITSAYDVNQKEKRISSFAATVNEEKTLTYPLEYGFGIAYHSGPKFLGQVDILVTKWSDFKIEGQRIPQYKDVVRLAVGGEYLALKEGSTSYFRRIPLRFGYALEPWYLKTTSGESIGGHFISLGIGLPFGRQGANLDASLEIGFRGDVSSVGAEETIVRGTISLWGFEPWFQRKK